ncbi:hypothetical protein LWI28_007983 [Acer negundo]|uniref:Uncharacterized protein n=1 Tax=Acer negundo TaxID=4023 RepID=A0AAD5NWR3_ACENE|nr:hypothetical protein LWI28_007983 [Acer negundo]
MRVTEESSDRSVTESERVLPLSLLSSTLILTDPRTVTANKRGLTLLVAKIEEGHGYIVFQYKSSSLHNQVVGLLLYQHQESCKHRSWNEAQDSDETA